MREILGRVAGRASEWAGSSFAVGFAIVSLNVYVLGGLCVGFSPEYQMWANTFMSGVSYAMLFFLQHTQNRDSLAVQVKLDELILAIKRADNKLLAVDELSEEELKSLIAKYKEIASSDEKL
jgi:low affinity Fe/Cu permease